MGLEASKVSELERKWVDALQELVDEFQDVSGFAPNHISVSGFQSGDIFNKTSKFYVTGVDISISVTNQIKY